MSIPATLIDLRDMQARFPENEHFVAACTDAIAALDTRPPGVIAALAMLESAITRLSPLVSASVGAPSHVAGRWPRQWRVTVRLDGTMSRSLLPLFDSEADALAFQAEANAAIEREV